MNEIFQTDRSTNNEIFYTKKIPASVPDFIPPAMVQTIHSKAGTGYHPSFIL